MQFRDSFLTQTSMAFARLHNGSPFWLNNSRVEGLAFISSPKIPQNPIQLTTLPKLIWGFPKIQVPQNGWFTMENPIEMDDLGVPLFSETSIWHLPGIFFQPSHFQVLQSVSFREREKIPSSLSNLVFSDTHFSKPMVIFRGGSKKRPKKEYIAKLGQFLTAHLHLWHTVDGSEFPNKPPGR